MSNPDFMNNIGSMMQGMGGSPSSGSQGNDMNAKIDQFMNSPEAEAFQSDPVLGPVMMDIKANGVGAVGKYLSNPAVMEKLMQLLPKQ